MCLKLKEFLIMKTFESMGTGFAIVMSIVLIVVIVYTIFKLRQQVKKAEDSERRKSSGKLPGEKNASRNQPRS